MRLLQLGANDELTITRDIVPDSTPYAILSHTWGTGGDDEVTFQDVTQKKGKRKPGYQKILFCGKHAKRDGLKYFWVDTCCIDKTSSAELSEAINSMYRWYEKSERCYVYLDDSRWLTRGWTLQELIAPSTVKFYSSNEHRLGDKKSLMCIIHEITKLPLLVLQGHWKSEIPMITRFSWFRQRNTTRPKDKAYCLMGILGVYMPPIYGEGERMRHSSVFTKIWNIAIK
ncbi:heterokaryon incompatibility protein-domain-containing protein [Truncatella angustata]|uniref:Heterokaryon incompatibility protein-domain-containing protein n=1 Tax=Truncatella angustata TaxID=152316 RepID=A0A9P9A171_9PEZI|nr:heterokaryon incompatibility protein-domain-containing protein [Truncatella angustata]KAH6659206.1 heterokaryon incompatibility protein-domain-containing protein [Truncatella angustata]